MGDDALKAVGMAEDPIRHVAAVAGAQCALPPFVNERVLLLGIVQPFHEVLEGTPTPIAVDVVNELLSVAG